MNTGLSDVPGVTVVPVPLSHDTVNEGLPKLGCSLGSGVYTGSSDFPGVAVVPLPVSHDTVKDGLPRVMLTLGTGSFVSPAGLAAGAAWTLFTLDHVVVNPEQKFHVPGKKADQGQHAAL